MTDSERTKLEQKLAAARARAQEPWPERRAGAEEAGRDADNAIGRFITENLDGLLGELQEEGEAAAAGVSAAANALIGAFHERMAVEARLTALCALIRPARPGDIQPTHAEQLVREATTLLRAGGEPPPTLRVDPRQPRHGATLTEVA